MPELPEVETVVRALNAFLVGRRIEAVKHISRMRLPFDLETATRLLRKRRIISVRRRAKYIIIECENAAGLLAHLGMTGSFRICPIQEEPAKHDRVHFRLDQGEELRFADARRFGFVQPVTLREAGGLPVELASLGPEPLSREFSAKSMLNHATRRKMPIKPFIMDQTVVVGVGNIYANEALFAAGINPTRPALSLNPDEWRRLTKAIRQILREAIKRGGSSIRTYRQVDGNEGAFQLSLQVYGKANTPCPRCNAPLITERQSGRSTFFCGKCQI